MGKFLDKTGLQTFLNKLKGMFVNKNNTNNCGENFSLNFDYNGNYNRIGPKNISIETPITINQIKDNSDLPILTCDGGGIYTVGSVTSEFDFYDGSYIYMVNGNNPHSGINYECDGIRFNTLPINNVIWNTNFNYKGLTISNEHDLFTKCNEKGLYTIGSVIANKIAIGDVNGNITGKSNEALMANGTTALVAKLSTKNKQVPLKDLESFVSQDEYISWNGTFLLLHYPMNVGEITTVHLYIENTNYQDVTRIIEIDTINTNSTIKIIIDNNETSIDFSRINNMEFSGRYRIYCYLSNNSVIYSKL